MCSDGIVSIGSEGIVAIGSDGIVSIGSDYSMIALVLLFETSLSSAGLVGSRSAGVVAS